MTDRRTNAVALAGEPSGWRATVRDLLRYLREASPPRADAVEWLLAETPATDRAAAEAQLSFLEAGGVVAADADGASPGPRGGEFLDTHDEGVLYEALTEAVGGVETLLESLAVRPLTDVEFVDLLERAFETDLESPEAARAHRQWLQALGYLEHDAGVNELTRAGRRRVETDGDLTPPRSQTREAEEAGPMGDRERSTADATDAPVTGRGAGDQSDATLDDSARSGRTAAEATDRTAEGGDGDEDPFAALKRRYDHTCMVCGDRRQRTPDAGFARVYHPMPTGEPHGGPADPANAVVVCPNHRADFEHGLLTVDPRTLTVEHAYDAAASGRTLATASGHDLGAQYLAYHNEVVAAF